MRGPTDGNNSFTRCQLFSLQRSRFRLHIEVRSYLDDRIYGSSSVGNLQQMVQVDSMFSGPAFPDGLYARCGIDKGAIHVEEDCFAAEANQKIQAPAVTASSFEVRDVDCKGKKIGPTATMIPQSTMTPIAWRSPIMTASDPIIGGPVKKPQ